MIALSNLWFVVPEDQWRSTKYILALPDVAYESPEEAEAAQSGGEIIVRYSKLFERVARDAAVYERVVRDNHD